MRGRQAQNLPPANPVYSTPYRQASALTRLTVNSRLTKPADPSCSEISHRGRNMIADSNSHIAWQRVQLRKGREALKALEIARFRTGEIAGPNGTTAQRAIASIKRKIAESEHCIAAYERRTKRPLATDLQSLAQVRWAVWNANALPQQPQSRAWHG